MNPITNAPQVPAQSCYTPIDKLTAWMARSDFAANALCGIPMSFWNTKLGNDPTKWAVEAIDIRIAYEKEMQKLGVGINLSTAPLAVNIGSPNDGVSAPLAEFYQKLWDEEYIKSRGGVSPAVNRMRGQGNGPYSGSYAPPRTMIAGK